MRRLPSIRKASLITKTNTMRKIKLMAVMALISTFAAAQEMYGELRGVLKNELKEMVSFATIKIMQDNHLIGGTQTDINGNYSYKPLIPGSYEVIVSEVGHKTKQISGVKVVPGDATKLNILLSSNTLTEVIVIGKIEKEDYTKSGCEQNVFSFESWDAEELNQNGAYVHGDLMSAIPAMVSDVVETGNGELHFRGGRSDSNGFYVDGIRVLDLNSMPSQSIENITVFTGGVPAMYGDVTSGVVLVTTKGYFSGIRDKNIRNHKAYEKRLEKREAQKMAKQVSDGILDQ